MFTGSYPLSVDEKGRIAIPTRFRQSFLEKHGGQVFLTRTYQPCVEIYPVPDYHAVVAQIEKEPDRRKADKAMQIFVGNAMEAEIDKQGRLLLPQFLRKLARIDTNACAVGQNKRIEIWSEDVWTAHITADGDSDAAADAFSGIVR